MWLHLQRLDVAADCMSLGSAGSIADACCLQVCGPTYASLPAAHPERQTPHPCRLQVWLANPADYFGRFPKADLLVSSDALDTQLEPGDTGLELPHAAHTTMNIGLPGRKTVDSIPSMLISSLAPVRAWTVGSHQLPLQHVLQVMHPADH